MEHQQTLPQTIEGQVFRRTTMPQMPQILVPQSRCTSQRDSADIHQPKQVRPREKGSRYGNCGAL